MKNRKLRKALTLVFSAMLLVAISVGATIAYLTDTDDVVNTFTVGHVDITLDEAEVKPDGTFESDHDKRVQENEYKLFPGHTYIKDPTVTVKGGSEEAYVRMLVKVERIDQLKKALSDSKYYGTDGVFLLQNLCGGWDPTVWEYEGYKEEGTTTGIYEFRYFKTVASAQDDTVLDDLFETITVPAEIDNVELQYLADVVINVNAHAIQADGFATADAAWGAITESDLTKYPAPKVEEGGEETA